MLLKYLLTLNGALLFRLEGLLSKFRHKVADWASKVEVLALE